MNVDHVTLVSSGGRRGALVNIFQDIPEHRTPKVIVTDASPLTSAGYLADHCELVPHISDEKFIPRMLEICRRYQVNTIVPTIDTELAVFAEHRAAFWDIGTDVLVSTPAVIELSSDKWVFHNWLVSKGFPSIQTFEKDGFSPEMIEGPVVAKPRAGSSSIGVVRAPNSAALNFANLNEDYIIQEQVEGTEVTIDFAVSKTGEFLGAVPRQRIEVRGGEVSKGRTIRNFMLEDFVREFAVALPGAYGVLNVQVFLSENSQVFSVLELNARVGGGYPLTHRAGGDFFSELLSGTSRPVDTWEENLLMLRYDDAVFVPTKQGAEL